MPINPATIITTTSDTEIANAVLTLPLVTQTKRNKNKAKITPLSADFILACRILLTKRTGKDKLSKKFLTEILPLLKKRQLHLLGLKITKVTLLW